MYYRIRTRVPDVPGSLATLTRACADAGVNILGFQLYPDLHGVTDDLVVEVPDSTPPASLLALVEEAGGVEVTIAPCSEHDLVDQPTLWLAAARRLVDDPARLPGELTALLGPRTSLSPTEQSRAAALTDLAAALSGPVTPERAGAAVEYEETGSGVVARVGAGIVGAATWTRLPAEDRAEGTLEVAPAWRRRGIGRQLLRRLCVVVAESGAGELVLLAPADQSGAAALLAAAGLRGRIRLRPDGLEVRLNLAGVPARS